MKKLLIIEDEPSIQFILNYFFKTDYHITIKNDGLEALEWLESGNEVDLVISDLNMPNINGFEVIESLRTSNLYKHIPILILSSMDGSSDRIRCLSLGADDYVIKPFNPEEVKLRVRNILRRSNRVLMSA